MKVREPSQPKLSQLDMEKGKTNKKNFATLLYFNMYSTTNEIVQKTISPGIQKRSIPNNKQAHSLTNIQYKKSFCVLLILHVSFYYSCHLLKAKQSKYFKNSGAQPEGGK